MNQLVACSQVVNRPALTQDVGQPFMRGWNGRNVFKVVRVFAVVIRNLLTIGPHTHGRASGVAVALELFLSVLEFGLLHLDQDVGRISLVFVEDANVCTFLFAAKRHLVFELNAFDGVPQVTAQHHNVQLAHGFFRGELDRFPTH